MKFKLAQPLLGSTLIVVSSEFVALQPENSPGGTASRLWGKVVCAMGSVRGIQPLSVKFCPSNNGSIGGGTRLMRNGTPGQFTDPLPLIRMESPQLEMKMSLFVYRKEAGGLLTRDQYQQQERHREFLHWWNDSNLTGVQPLDIGPRSEVDWGYLCHLKLDWTAWEYFS